MTLYAIDWIRGKQVYTSIQRKRVCSTLRGYSVFHLVLSIAGTLGCLGFYLFSDDKPPDALRTTGFFLASFLVANHLSHKISTWVPSFQEKTAPQ
jgi:hypothetical protein